MYELEKLSLVIGPGSLSKPTTISPDLNVPISLVERK